MGMTVYPSWPRAPGVPGDHQTLLLPCGFAFPPLAPMLEPCLAVSWLFQEVPIWEGEWSHAQVHVTGTQPQVCVHVPVSAWRSSTAGVGGGKGRRSCPFQPTCACCSLGTSGWSVGPASIRHWPRDQRCAVPTCSRHQRYIDSFINSFTPSCCKCLLLTVAEVLHWRVEVAGEDFPEAGPCGVCARVTCVCTWTEVYVCRAPARTNTCTHTCAQ